MARAVHQGASRLAFLGRAASLQESLGVGDVLRVELPDDLRRLGPTDLLAGICSETAGYCGRAAPNAARPWSVREREAGRR